jgi:hypothetical protein
VALVLTPAIAFAFRNEPEGFRGIAWGTEFSTALGDMTPIEESGKTRLYTRADESMSIGAAQVDKIAYAFVDGKFDSALVQTKGLVNNRAMLDALRAQFNEPIRPNRFMDDYYWKGKVTTIAFNCRLSLQGECTTAFVGRKLHIQ